MIDYNIEYHDVGTDSFFFRKHNDSFHPTVIFLANNRDSKSIRNYVENISAVYKNIGKIFFNRFSEALLTPQFSFWCLLPDLFLDSRFFINLCLASNSTFLLNYLNKYYFRFSKMPTPNNPKH